MAASTSDDLVEGFDVEFVDQTIDKVKIECVICLLVLRKPVQATPCGHRFCANCMEKLKRQQNDGRRTLCPIDRRIVENIFADTGHERDILDHVVRCPNSGSGCEWTQELLYLEKHLLNCDYGKIVCLRCHSACFRNQLQEHLQLDCISECKYAVIGCQFKGTPKLLAEHENIKVDEHIFLQVALNGQMKQEISQLQIKSQNQEQVIQQMQEKCRNQEKSFQQEISQSQIKSKDQEKVIQQMKVKSQNQEKTFQQEISQSQIKSKDQEKVIQQMKEKNENQEKAIQCLQDKQKELVSNIPLLHQSCPFTFTIKNVSTMIKDRNYKEKLYSDTFTFLNGYRGQLQVFLNGDGEENRNHISVFFQIKEGPFDDYLEWPMVFGLITFEMFINGKRVDKHSINCKEDSDDLKIYYVKPPGGQGYGYSKFYRHDQLPENIDGDEIKFTVNVSRI